MSQTIPPGRTRGEGNKFYAVFGKPLADWVRPERTTQREGNYREGKKIQIAREVIRGLLLGALHTK